MSSEIGSGLFAIEIEEERRETDREKSDKVLR